MGPAIRYYSALVGAWSGPFAITVRDPRAVGATRAPFPVKLALRSIGLVPVLGRSTMSTTLAPVGDPKERTFLHTTRVSSAGITLYETRETIRVHEDERTFDMHGEQRALFGQIEPYASEGAIDDEAKRATYRIPWLGEELVQRTEIETGGLRLTQSTAFSHAEVLLARATAR